MIIALTSFFDKDHNTNFSVEKIVVWLCPLVNIILMILMENYYTEVSNFDKGKEQYKYVKNNN